MVPEINTVILTKYEIERAALSRIIHVLTRSCVQAHKQTNLGQDK